MGQGFCHFLFVPIHNRKRFRQAEDRCCGLGVKADIAQEKTPELAAAAPTLEGAQ